MKSSAKIAVLVCTILLCIVVVVLSFRQHTEVPKHGKRENIPASGFAVNDTGGLVPGNPKNGVDDLNLIYKLYSQHQQQMNDACVANGTGTLLWDVMKNPTKYGFKDKADCMRVLTNPDDQYGDAEKSKPGKVVPYVTSCYRYDGTMIGSPKKEGTRDVIAYTQLYYHPNVRSFPHQKTTYNPVGFYLVLWDDGQVEKIPYDEALWSRTSKGKSTRTLGFKGQAGLLPDTIDYDQKWATLGIKGPRGRAGGKGQSVEELVISK